LRQRWLDVARDEQLTPEDEWSTWMLLAGRGFGKTRTAAEDVAYYGLKNAKSRIAVVAETFADGRDTCIEGESGLLSILPVDEILIWNRSLGELILKNGTRYKIYSGDKPDQLRGPQFHRAWCDELAKYRYAQETWDNLMLGLRLGEAQAIVTTTPRPLKIIREIKDDPDTVVSTGSTYDNIDNLSERFRARILRRYEGTRLGRQELHAEILDDVPGALWNRSVIENNRVSVAPELVRVVVALDPSVTSDEESAECGIVVAGKGVDGHGYVLADRSARISPEGWGRRAVVAFDEFEADRIIGEVNNGGDLVETVIRTIDHNVPYKAVRASRGKRVRAEPVASLDEQGRVHHVGMHAELEDQMVAFLPDGTDEGTDRVDARVWALTELVVEPQFEPLIGRA
jgi:phage terminase large subunit-like protein